MNEKPAAIAHQALQQQAQHGVLLQGGQGDWSPARSALRVAGVDEAGRGPLVGSVVAAAVILHPDRPIGGLADSKTLSARKRAHLFAQIIEQCAACAIAQATAAEIDQLNILQATFLAMRRAVSALPMPAEVVWVDGNQIPPGLSVPVQAVVHGDRLHGCISAASILAKVSRDQQMHDLHGLFPQYGFDRHKGYPTAAHLAALAQHGVVDEHRRSFAPVKRVLAAKP